MGQPPDHLQIAYRAPLRLIIRYWKELDSYPAAIGRTRSPYHAKKATLDLLNQPVTLTDLDSVLLTWRRTNRSFRSRRLLHDYRRGSCLSCRRRPDEPSIITA